MGPATDRLTPAIAVTREPAPRPRRHLKFRGELPPLEPSLLPTLEPSPLPPLRPVRRSAAPAEQPSAPEAPAWSPVTVAVLLFAAVWVCFGALAVAVTAPPAADVAGLGHLLATGAAVVALVLVTLSVAHTQVSGLRPPPGVVVVVALGLGQAALAAAIGSGHRDLWGVGAWVFVLIGAAVPLAWVGGHFQCGVRRQRVERHASLAASWIERARRQAHQTVQSVLRHDVRSMLFVIDGAARTLADPSLTPNQRASFGEMLHEGVAQLGALMDVRSEEIQPFAVAGVVRAVVHAERKGGCVVSADLPDQLTAEGRAADVAAVLRTLVTLIARDSGRGARISSLVAGEAVVVLVEPAGADPLPLTTDRWDEIWAESFKSPRQGDEIALDLYVAARLLAEQGGDLWSTAGQARFAVRLPAAADSNS